MDPRALTNNRPPVNVEALLRTKWDFDFYNNEKFRAWLIDELAVFPMPPGYTLFQYVKERLNKSQGTNGQQDAAPAQPVAPSYNHTANPSHEQQFSQPSMSTATAMDPQFSFQQPPPAYSASQDQTMFQSALRNPTAVFAQGNTLVNPAMLNNHSAVPYGATPYTNGYAQPQLQSVQPQQLQFHHYQHPQASTSKQSTPPIKREPSPVKREPSPPKVKPARFADATPAAASSSKAAADTSFANLDEFWSKSLKDVRDELKTLHKTPLRTIAKLIKSLEVLTAKKGSSGGDPSAVPVEGRVDILKMLYLANNKEAFSAFVSEESGRNFIYTWLKEGVLGKGKKTDSANDLKASLLPILQVIDKMPFKLDHLRKHSFGPCINKIIKDESHAASVLKLANKIHKDWTELSQGSASTATGTTTKKRTESPTVTDADARKKAKTMTGAKKAGSPAPETATKPRITVKSATGGTAKAMPSFMKVKQATAETTPTEAFNPFSEALNMIKIGAGGVASSSSRPAGSRIASLGKKKKSVRWEPDDKLCKVKMVDKLVYGDEYGNELPESELAHESTHQMDIDEGLAFKKHSGIDEEVEWYEPTVVDIPATVAGNLIAYPAEDNCSKYPRNDGDIQQEREAGVLAVTYLSEEDIPPTPHEPSHVDAEQLDGTEPIEMRIGPELSKDGELVQIISNAQIHASMSTAPVNDLEVADLLSRVNPDMLANLLQNPIPDISGGFQPVPAETNSFVPDNGWEGWNNGPQPSQAATFQSQQAPRKGRNRGRGRGGSGNAASVPQQQQNSGEPPSKKAKKSATPCKWNLKGACQFGNECSFAHTQP